MDEGVKTKSVSLPIDIITKIAIDAASNILSENADIAKNISLTFANFAKKWVIVYKNQENGKLNVIGYDEYDACADMVANMHGTDEVVMYVLRYGVPRKNVRVQVKARL